MASDLSDAVNFVIGAGILTALGWLSPLRHIGAFVAVFFPGKCSCCRAKPALRETLCERCFDNSLREDE